MMQEFRKVYEYTDKDLFIKENPDLFKKMKRSRVLTKYFKHFKSKKHYKLSLKELRKEVLKYKTRTDLFIGNHNAYSQALKTGLIELIPKRHRNLNCPKFYKWLKREVLRIKELSLFKIKHGNLYDIIMNSKNSKNKAVCKKLTKRKYTQNSIGESSLRLFLKKAFIDTSFKKVKLECMKNYKTGRLLELDFYSKDMKLAFEHNSKFHNLEIDEIKLKLCKQNGIKLITFNDLFNEYGFKSEKEAETLIKKNLTNNNIHFNNKAVFKWVFPRNVTKWNIVKVKRIVSKYSVLKKFIKKEYGAYLYICKIGRRDLLKSLKQRVIKSKYTDSFLKKEALKFSSLNQLKVYKPAIFSAIRQRKKLHQEIKNYHKLAC